MFSLNFIKKTISSSLNLLFQNKCLGCNIRDQIICPICLNKIQISEEIEDKNIFAIFSYKDPLVRNIIWELKYHHHRQLGNFLGKILYDSFIEKISEIREFSKNKKIIIIPVPLTRKRNNFRGYNQSKEIALGFFQRNKDIFELKDKIIARKKGFIPQTKIRNRKDRITNISGAFYLKDKKFKIRGQTIIIIDDVTTTGSTLKEITKILKNNGAKKIFGFTIAH